MALIKKYQSGNKIEEPDFKQYITEQMLAGKFDKKRASDVESFLDTGFAKPWIVKERNEYKPAMRTVSVDPRREKEIGDIWNYIIKNEYGGDEQAFFDDWEQQDNPQREQKFWDYATNIASKYLKDQSTDTVGHTWDNLEDVQNIANITAGGYSPEAFQNLSKVANKLGWGVNRYMISDDELEKIRLAEEAKAEEEQKRIDAEVKEQKLSELSTRLQSLGFTEEIASQLADSGVVIEDEIDPSSDRYLMSDYIKQQGISIIKTPDGSRHYFKDGERINSFGGFISEDVFNPNYGKSFQVTPQGFKVLDADKYKENEFATSEYEDPGNLRKELLFNNPEYEGFKFYGESGDDFRGNWNVDALGRRDFLQRIRRIASDGTSSLLTKGEEGYVDEAGNVIKLPDFIGFGQREKIQEDLISNLFENPQSIMYGIKASNTTRYTGMTESIEGLERAIRFLETSPLKDQKKGKTFNSTTKIKKKSKEVAALARWFLENGTEEEKRKAEDVLDRLIKLSAEYSDVDEFGNTVIGFLKTGGVVKAEKGIDSSYLVDLNTKYFRDVSEDAKKKVEKDELKTKKRKEQPKVKDISGTVEDQIRETVNDPLKLLSAAGVGASFIPGVGLIGGLVTTGADALQAADRGEWTSDDTKRLLSNIGFSALAGIGLGGARLMKGTSKLGRVAKVANKSKKTARAITKIDEPIEMIGKAADRAKKLGVKNVSESTDRLTTLTKKLGGDANDAFKTIFNNGKPKLVSNGNKFVYKPSTSLVDVAKDIYETGDKALDSAELASAIIKDLNVAKDLTKATTSAFVSHAKNVGEPVVNAFKTISSHIPQLAGKGFRYGVGTANVISAGSGALEVGQSIADEGNLWRGLKYADAGAAQRLALGAAGLRGVWRNRRNAELLTTHATRQNPATITIDGKAHNVRGPLTNRKGSIRDSFRKEKTRQAKDIEHLKKYLNENLILKEGTDRGTLVEQLMKSLNDGAKYKFQEGSGWQLNPDIDFGTDLYRARRIRERVEAMINTGNWNTFLPNYSSRISINKKGGIIKAQKGITTDYFSLSNIARGNNPTFNFTNKLNFTNSLSSTKSKFSYVNPITRKAREEFGAKYPLIQAYLDNTPRLINGEVRSEGNPVSGTHDVNLKEFDKVAFEPKPYSNHTTLAAEGLRYLFNKRGNNEALRYGLAAAGQIPKMSRIPHTYNRTSQTNQLLAEKQAGDLASGARRISESTTNIDKSFGVMLEGLTRSKNAILEGAYRDLKANRAIKDQEQAQNDKIDLINLQQADRESALGAESRRMMNQLRFNKELADTASTSNLMAGIGKYFSELPYKKALHEYTQLQKDPNIKTLQDEYSYMSREGLQKFREDYEKEEAWDKSGRTFEESDGGIKWKQQMDNITNQIEALRFRLSNSATSVQGYKMLLQKGGRIPLNERIALENVRYNHKRLLKNQDNFLKSILENNKMYQKAFIKVFK